MMEKNYFVTRLINVIVARDPTDSLEDAKGLFLIMDYWPTDFRKIITLQESKQIETDHLKVLLYNCLCAMHYVNSANVLHRDIKPGNVLNNELCQVSLCDFGIARTKPKVKKN